MDSSFGGEIVKLGLAGLVIYLITLPLIQYLIKSNEAKDERINQLVDSHLAQDAQRHAKVISSLEHVEHNLGNMERAFSALPQAMMDRVEKVYPPASPTTNINVTTPPVAPVNNK